MTFEYEEKQSKSRFVDVFWHTRDTTDGMYLAAADACWDMATRGHFPHSQIWTRIQHRADQLHLFS